MKRSHLSASLAGDATSTTAASVATADPMTFEITHLGDLELASLRRRWRKLTRQDAPAHLSRHVLLGMLVYRIQASAYGDLDGETARYLASVAREVSAGSLQPVRPVDDDRVGRLKPGTILVREHGGTSHRVMVLKEGFAWLGTTYDSLSAVAKAITGTSWNGPRFFGLRDRTADKERPKRSSAVSEARP